MDLATSLDRMMLRVLRVTPQPIDPGHANPSEPEERALGLAIVISGLRCTLQYLVLPVVLPLIGLWSGLSLAIVLLFDLLALGLLVASLRYFWRVQHPRRFAILPLSGTIFLIIIASLAFDLWSIGASTYTLPR
jgi:hypothetical protein